jgi:hypothetical protein
MSQPWPSTGGYYDEGWWAADGAQATATFAAERAAEPYFVPARRWHKHESATLLNIASARRYRSQQRTIQRFTELA